MVFKSIIYYFSNWFSNTSLKPIFFMLYYNQVINLNKIGIYNEIGDGQVFFKTIKKVIKKAIRLEKLVNIECNIIIVDDTYIHQLNKEYRNIDRPTDVITFALEDEKKCILPTKRRVLGDIYISIDTARTQANLYKHSIEREICFLAVHGFYHLLSYDHQTKEEEKIMFQKQEEVLSACGIKR